MLAQLDHATSCELYGAEAKNGETCSRASGFVWSGWGVGFMGTEFWARRFRDLWDKKSYMGGNRLGRLKNPNVIF
jgi:hypothetical protein